MCKITVLIFTKSFDEKVQKFWDQSFEIKIASEIVNFLLNKLNVEKLVELTFETVVYYSQYC